LLLRSALLPLIIAAGLWFGGLAGAALAREHRTVALAERVQLEASGAATDTTDASAAFHAEGTPPEKLYAEAHALVDRYVLAGRLCGAWIGLVVALKLITLAWRPRRPEFETDAVRCVACARCFTYCPQEQKRRQTPDAESDGLEQWNGGESTMGVMECWSTGVLQRNFATPGAQQVLESREITPSSVPGCASAAPTSASSLLM